MLFALSALLFLLRPIKTGNFVRRSVRILAGTFQLQELGPENMFRALIAGRKSGEILIKLGIIKDHFAIKTI